MFGIQNFDLFLVSAVILNVTPGPDTMYILGRSLSEGRKAGVVSVLGISSGLLLHTIAVSVGLSAIFLSSSILFALVKLIGATYLVYLGIKTLMRRGSPTYESAAVVPANSWTIYRQGLLTNALNPKVALFFLALLPQFGSQTPQHSGLPFFLLGLTFIATTTSWCLILAISASHFRGAIQRSDRFRRWIDSLLGMMFIGLGLKLGFASHEN